MNARKAKELRKAARELADPNTPNELKTVVSGKRVYFKDELQPDGSYEAKPIEVPTFQSFYPQNSYRRVYKDLKRAVKLSRSNPTTI